jgi:diguanylate cyclase (GGDEF)-like protein
VAYLLLALPRLFRNLFPPAMDLAQMAEALMAVVLLFNVHAVYKQWLLRNLRKQLTEPSGTDESEPWAIETGPTLPTDPVTGLSSRSAAEQFLAKEIAATTRRSKPLSLLMLCVNELDEMSRRHGASLSDAVLKEFAFRLKSAIRGSDLAARTSGDDFALVLPDCSADDVRRVLDRVHPLEIPWGNQRLTLDYSAAWVDHQRGELPADLLYRAEQMLQLYKSAGQDNLSPSLSTG